MEHADISNDNIEEFAIRNDAFKHLTNLKELYLGFNKIHYINQDVFLSIGKTLSELHIEHNHITSLQGPVFSHAHYLERLDLGGNSIEFI